MGVDGKEIETIAVDLYVDPLCPWAWLTSRWLLEVEQVRDITITWHIMSLAVLNEGRELPPQYAELMARGMGPVRLIVAAEQQVGPQVVQPLYEGIASRFHNQGRDDQAAVLAEALAEAGLPPELLAAADDPAWDEAVRASHHAGMDPVGMDCGTPVLHIAGTAVFGPVVSPAPRGAAAGKLFDGVVACMTTPGFYELKRGREVGPIFD